MRLGRTARLAAAALTGGVLAAAAGCSGGGTSTGSAPPSRTLAPDPGGGGHPDAAWPTYGRDFARSGVADAARPGRLAVSWRVHLDGAVYGQPLLVGNLVIAATENDSIYGLDQATGKVAWRTHVGTPVPLADLPCGNIDPLGITGTPVYNPASGLVYAVAETSGYHHVLVGVSVRDGSIQVERDIRTPDGQPRYDQQRPALTIAAGRVYVAFGGLAGDCGPYRGSVVGIPLSGAGPMISYVVPTPREGAVWATGGPVTGPDGTMYVSVGNGSEYQLRRQRLGDRAVPRAAPDRRLRAVHLAPRQRQRPRPRLHPAGPAARRDAARGRQERHRVPGQGGSPGRRRRSGGAGGGLPRLRPGRGPGQRRVRAVRAGRAGRGRHRREHDHGAVARAGQRLGLPRRSAAARSGSPTGRLEPCTSWTRRPARPGTRWAWAPRCRTSRRCR